MNWTVSEFDSFGLDWILSVSHLIRLGSDFGWAGIEIVGLHSIGLILYRIGLDRVGSG